MIEDLFTVSVLASGIRLATPYLYAAIGETFGQRSGVLNLGVEGIMLMGAFTSFYAVYRSESLALGVLVALVVGLLMGLARPSSMTARPSKASAASASTCLAGPEQLLFNISRHGRDRQWLKVAIPILSDLPVVGEMFFQRNLLCICLALVPWRGSCSADHAGA